MIPRCKFQKKPPIVDTTGTSSYLVSIPEKLMPKLQSSSLSRFPGYGFSAHAAAKSAMDSMARIMATELGPIGITENVVGPGLTPTDATAGQPKEMHEQIAGITPLKRLGLPDDIAGIILFLASALSDYLSGEYITLTGGSFII